MIWYVCFRWLAGVRTELWVRELGEVCCNVSSPYRNPSLGRYLDVGNAQLHRSRRIKGKSLTPFCVGAIIIANYYLIFSKLFPLMMVG